MKKLIIALTFSLAVCLAVHPGAAQAATATSLANCTVKNINYGFGFGKQMNLVCSTPNSSTDTVFILYLTGGGGSANCPATDIDTIKILESLAQAAKLSGKTITVWSSPTTCGTTTVNGLVSIELNG